MESVNVPFTLPDMLAGFVEGKGLAKATPSELTLEFVLKDGVFNVLKSGVKEIRIPHSEIEYVRIKHGIFRDKMNIRVKSLRWLADFPGCDSCELTLRVARRNRAQAGDMVQVLGRV
jgi:hypothetical protein